MNKLEVLELMMSMLDGTGVTIPDDTDEFDIYGPATAVDVNSLRENIQEEIELIKEKERG